MRGLAYYLAMETIKDIQVEVIGYGNAILATAVGKFSVEVTNEKQPFITVKLLEKLELDVIRPGFAENLRLSVPDASVTTPVLGPQDSGMVGLQLSSKQIHAESPLYIDYMKLSFPAFTQSHNPHKFITPQSAADPATDA